MAMRARQALLLRRHQLSGHSNIAGQFHSPSRAITDQPTRAALHTVNRPIDEELNADQKLRFWNSAQPGEVLDGRFKTVAKLGHGGGSTVWLAECTTDSRSKNNQLPKFVTIKVAAIDTDASGELQRSKVIAQANPAHEGFDFVRKSLDNFQVQGPCGMHKCLVFEPTRETLWRFQQRMPDGRVPLPLLKVFMYCLLQAVDYLHSECDLIHTDIKDDNIMIRFENESILADFVSRATKETQFSHTNPETGRVTYKSNSEFGDLGDGGFTPELGDFDHAYPGFKGKRRHVAPIQSHRYRAPEVLLGCPWSYSVDVWNLGLLMWDLLEGIPLFRPAGSDGEYDSHVHFAQMVALLGDPPLPVRMREKAMREGKQYRLPNPVINSRGKSCHTVNDFWGGPFFDEEARIVRQDVVDSMKGKTLEDTITVLSGDEKGLFLDFASGMLEWIPEWRKTPKELMDHPFFDSLYEDKNGPPSRRDWVKKRKAEADRAKENAAGEAPHGTATT